VPFYVIVEHGRWITCSSRIISFEK